MTVHKVTGRLRKEMRKKLALLWIQFGEMPAHVRENFDGIYTINEINYLNECLGLPQVNWIEEIKKAG